MSTRWRCPPDSWCGYSSARAGRQPDALEQLADAASSGAGCRSRRAARSPRRSGAPTRCTGLSECSAPWNTIAALVQRTARSRPGFIAVDVLAAEQDLARRRASRPAAGAARRRRSSTCRTPTRRPARPCRRRRSSRSTPRTAGTSTPPAPVRHVQVGELEHRLIASSSQLPQPRVEDLLQRPTAHREREHDERRCRRRRAGSTTTRRG